MSRPLAAEVFERMAGAPDSQIDLVASALVIAAEDAPPVDPAACRARIAALARDAAPAVAGSASRRAQIEAFHRSFFVEQGFSGNREDYYDPDNSYLHRVLERRTGIPISLSIVYLAVGRHLGFDVRGVGFPGHFLVKHVGREEIVVDPFYGRILDRAGCGALLRERAGPAAVLDPGLHLRAASNRGILIRLLSNLKHIWLGRGDLVRALAHCDRILALAPDSAADLRDRGLLYDRLGCAGAAAADFERYLALVPGGPESEALRRRVSALRGARSTLH